MEACFTLTVYGSNAMTYSHTTSQGKAMLTASADCNSAMLTRSISFYSFLRWERVSQSVTLLLCADCRVPAPIRSCSVCVLVTSVFLTGSGYFHAYSNCAIYAAVYNMFARHREHIWQNNAAWKSICWSWHLSLFNTARPPCTKISCTAIKIRYCTGLYCTWVFTQR